jgi:hypothetical protein
MLSDPKSEPGNVDRHGPELGSSGWQGQGKGDANRTTPRAPCPQCGFEMNAIRGSRDAVCWNCGFKDSCCY